MPGGGRSNAPKLSEAELREKLAAFYVQFVNTIESATTRAALETTDLDLRMRIIQGRLQAVRACRQACLQRHPTAAFVDTWSLCIQFEKYLTTPRPQETLGSSHEFMLAAVRTLRQDIEDLGKLFLRPEQQAEVKQKLERFASANPFSTQSEVLLPSQDTQTAIPQLGWLLNLPLSPFRALEGVDQTAQAVNELTAVASRFTQISEDLPRELQWNASLLLLQARHELEGAGTDLDRRQTNLVATLREVRATLHDASNAVARLDPTLASADRTVRAVTEASQAISATLQTYTQMVMELYPPRPQGEQPAAPAGRPFDILDYARTAEGITAAAGELRAVLVEFQKLATTNSVTARVQELEASAQKAVAQTETSARQLTDHITKRVLQVLAAGFVLLVAYCFISAGVKKKSPAA
jgi:hypothetical protein